MDDQSWFEVMLLLFGVVAGWMLSTRGRAPTKAQITKAHDTTKRHHDRRKKAKLALVEAKKIQAEKDAEKERERIKRLELSELVRLIRETFSRKD